MNDIDAAKILIRCLDLTSLNEKDTEETITELCKKSSTAYGNTAAVCVFSKFIPLALQQLANHTKIATVVNFPKGEPDIQSTIKEINRALKAGADEIDAVLPYQDFIAGKLDFCTDYLQQTRAACGEKTLKIILETGELQTTRLIKSATKLCIDCGADFIKTSTGKTKTSATPEAANAILETIKSSGKNVGFKASGGIKTLEDAKKYLTLAISIMGADWVNPSVFRIGASSLLTNLLQTIEKGY